MTIGLNTRCGCESEPDDSFLPPLFAVHGLRQTVGQLLKYHCAPPAGTNAQLVKFHFSECALRTGLRNAYAVYWVGNDRDEEQPNRETLFGLSVAVPSSECMSGNVAGTRPEP